MFSRLFFFFNSQLIIVGRIQSLRRTQKSLYHPRKIELKNTSIPRYKLNAPPLVLNGTLAVNAVKERIFKELRKSFGSLKIGSLLFLVTTAYHHFHSRLLAAAAIGSQISQQGSHGSTETTKPLGRPCSFGVFA